MDVAVLGCAGRMGRAVMAEVLAAPDLRLAAGLERHGHDALGRDLGTLAGAEALGIAAGDDAGLALRGARVAIEFSSPEASAAHAGQAAAAGVAYVVGTTGFDASHKEALERAARRIPIIWAANMSLGVNLLVALAERVGRALGPEAFDVEILEMHHRHKVDAPSGTALALGEAVARGRGVALDRVAVRGRDGMTGPREPGAIGFAALRGGDVVGDHVVTFAGVGERLELAHRATDRRIYARGAVQAARWLAGRPPGLYGMGHVLGLE
jgi:4-hydroxy-tetrahydrodipicolinate reductase